MAYGEQIFDVYRKSLIAMGVSEQSLKTALISFATGFAAGLHNNDEDMQKKMIQQLTVKPTIN